MMAKFKTGFTNGHALFVGVLFIAGMLFGGY